MSEDQPNPKESAPGIPADDDLETIGMVERALEQPKGSRVNEPDRIGAYRILQRIGEGGMGIVFVAEQERPVRRRVAIKLIKLGMDSRSLVARFESERQALALMDHPNIARVFDGGTTDSGRPFFAMELVRGVSIHRYCNEKNLSMRGRIEVFLDVCSGVLHAHQKGIIHRDIKPSNVLVSTQDELPVPKIIDFGLAKAMGQSLTDKTLYTTYGQIVGTPDYMSPEQLDRSVRDVDTRSDIYSLGVLLYELLVGDLPYDWEERRKASLEEVCRRLLEADPVRPSTRVVLRKTSTGPGSGKTASDRSSGANALSRRLRGDLDWIIMKAMERDRSRRYQSVGDLVRDLYAYINDQPVSAGPPSTLYRLKKFFRRNKAKVIASSAVLLSLAIGFVVSTVLFIQAKRARDLAVEREFAATIAKEQADEALRAVKRERDEKQFLLDVLKLADFKEEAGKLWPIAPSMVSALSLWVEGVRDLVDRSTGYRKKLDELGREPGRVMVSAARTEALTEALTDAPTGAPTEAVDRLRDFVADLERFSDPDRAVGLFARVQRRLSLAETIEEETVGRWGVRWEEAIASIADRNECPRYDGLRIEPQVGLIPSGRNSETGLWEFSHRLTGEIRRLDRDGRPQISEATGLVFVLIPGGEFEMGSIPPGRRRKLGSPNCDPFAQPDEAPIRKVRLSPFFLSKYEMTQAQWMRIGESDPSLFGADRQIGGHQHTTLHPVESLGFEECRQMMFRLGLELPTEAQWEYSARAGTTTIWWTGNQKESLVGAANLADLNYVRYYGPNEANHEQWLDDGYGATAPVGSFRANDFGLHDVIGNVWEWCRDANTHYSSPVVSEDGLRRDEDKRYRRYRGGCFDNLSTRGRSGTRANLLPEPGNGYMGVRPSLPIEVR